MIFPRWYIRYLPLCLVLLCVGICPVYAGVAFTTLYSFCGGDGAEPYSALVQGKDGVFYGTTFYGGDGGKGTIYRITPIGTHATLYSFGGGDGANPFGGLIQGADGDFYGTTMFGGTGGGGTVFKITTNGTLTTLVNFDGANGDTPWAALAEGPDGNFYGTTQSGGTNGFHGTVFKMGPTGTLTTMATFYWDYGSQPHSAPLILGPDGNWYGTTTKGGTGPTGDPSGAGNIFRMAPDGTVTSFCSLVLDEGGWPETGLVLGADGNFYGTTSVGGTPGGIYGTIFKLTPSGVYTNLIRFNGADGAGPNAQLIQASDGNFYGMTTFGAQYGQGTVFRMSPAGALENLITFNGTNGAYAYGGMVQASDGNFYGTTARGGACGAGTFFRLSMPLPPVFKSAKKLGDALELTWTTVAGQTYQLQYSAGMNASNWTELGLPFAATNGTTTVSAAIGPDPQRFFRVTVLP